MKRKIIYIVVIKSKIHYKFLTKQAQWPFLLQKFPSPPSIRWDPLMNFKDGTHDRKLIHLFRTPENIISLDATLPQALPLDAGALWLSFMQ